MICALISALYSREGAKKISGSSERKAATWTGVSRKQILRTLGSMPASRSGRTQSGERALAAYCKAVELKRETLKVGTTLKQGSHGCSIAVASCPRKYSIFVRIGYIEIRLQSSVKVRSRSTSSRLRTTC